MSEKERAEGKWNADEESFWKKLAGITHELRTPLSTILIAVEVLQKETAGHLTPEASRHLALIEKNAERLSRMIEDSLAMSSIRKDVLPSRPADLEIESFLDTLIREMRPLFERKGLSLLLSIAKNTPSSFTSDEDLLHRILVNLLTNACKYTRKGGAELRFEKTDNSLRFIVTDSGIGIPPEEASNVFKDFYRAGNVGGEPGVGLGLSLSNRLAGNLNGSLSFESKPGEGSSFTLSLPPDGLSRMNSNNG